jgi:DNA topoisomerase-1
MASKLIIVESPSKAKTIQKYLGPGYRVQASMGHVRDLPKSKLGVDVDHDFAPVYEVAEGKQKVVKDLQSAIRSASEVYLATDPDREGEAIAWHVVEATKIPKSKSVHRVTFHEITKSAVQDAIAHPRQIDRHLVDAQQARRVLDRLVGYRLSPLLWDKVRRGLSAGRVQSVAVRLVVEREREIEGFKPQEYWTIEADLAKQSPKAQKFRAVLVERAGKKLGKFAIENQEAANAIVADLDRAEYVVRTIARKDKKRTPAPPFTTSTLQQEAGRKLGMSAKTTMRIAQQLYEGVDVGGTEGTVGLITYMRTDSLNVSKEAQTEARALIGERYGADYVPPRPNVYKTRAKGAQEAHEAIRPTSSRRLPENLRAALSRDQYRLYDLIWKRFIASQMAPAIFDSTTVDIAAGRGVRPNGVPAATPPYLFRATGSVLRFPGFLAVYNVSLDEGEDDEDKEALLPPLVEGELLKLLQLLPLQHWTQPPPRYTEASLVKELEQLGIGRPSTYAPTISTITEREYVQVVDKKLVPTTLGNIVNDLLVAHFPEIVDYNFTSQMEQQLDDIAEGDRTWVPVIRGFFDPFERTLAAAQQEMKSVKGEGIATDLPCPACGAPLMVRLGKNGEFLACSRHPDCSFTGDLVRDADGRIQLAQQPELADADQTCDKCGRPMVVKKSKFGMFLACTGYPECKNIRRVSKKTGAVAPAPVPIEGETCPVDGAQLVRRHGPYGEFISCANYPTCKYIKRETTGVACPRPGCKGEIVVKKSKRGKYFYGCSEYPKCDTVYWDKPVAEPCPECNAPFMLEKTTKKGTTRTCVREECGHKEDVPSTGAPAPTAPRTGSEGRVAS